MDQSRSRPNGWVAVGQEWLGAGGGVVVLFAQIVGDVNMHEASTARAGESTTLTMHLASGHMRVRARSFAEAAEQLAQWLKTQPEIEAG